MAKEPFVEEEGKDGRNIPLTPQPLWDIRPLVRDGVDKEREYTTISEGWS